jgi:hypothetical protein
MDQVTQVLAGGMAQSTRALVLVGNGFGGAGFGIGKHLEAAMATKIALANAQVCAGRGGGGGSCCLTQVVPRCTCVPSPLCPLAFISTAPPHACPALTSCCSAT